MPLGKSVRSKATGTLNGLIAEFILVGMSKCGVTVFTKRAILLVRFMLRDSKIAQEENEL